MLTHRRLRLIHPVLVSVEFARFLGQFRITANACYIFPRCPYRHPALRESCLTVMRRLRRLAVRACKITKKNLNCQTIRINLFESRPKYGSLAYHFVQTKNFVNAPQNRFNYWLTRTILRSIWGFDSSSPFVSVLETSCSCTGNKLFPAWKLFVS